MCITLDRRLKEFMEYAKDHTKTKFKITCGLRSTTEQQKLYAIGRTRPGKRVTNCDGVVKKSKHQLGKAVDIAVIKNNTISWNIKDYEILINELKTLSKAYGIKLVFGADFKRLKDYPHIEIGDEK